MILSKRMKISNKDILGFFPKESVLSTNIVVACQRHAVEIVFSWASSLYTKRVKSIIKKLCKEGFITENVKIALFTIGKYCVDQSSETI